MGKLKANTSGSLRRSGRRSGARVVVVSAVVVVGVIAVRRSRANRSSASSTSFDDLPHLPPIPRSADSVATSVRGAVTTAPVSVVKPTTVVTPAAAEQLPGIAPSLAFGPDPSADDVDQDIDADEEPPIWAGVAESSAEPPTDVLPPFEAAFTGQPFSPTPAGQAEGTPAVVNFPPPENSAGTPAPWSALSVDPWAAPDAESEPWPAAVPPSPDPPERGAKGSSRWSSTSTGRKVLGVVGLVCLVGLVLATIVVATH